MEYNPYNAWNVISNSELFNNFNRFNKTCCLTEFDSITVPIQYHDSTKWF